MTPIELSIWDKANLSPADQATMITLKQAYVTAKNKGDENNAQKINELAEQIRSGYGYSGGSDGSGHTSLTPPTGSIGGGGGNIALIVGVVLLIILGSR